MKNRLWYLGFLSLTSLLYLIEGKTIFLLFISFLAYFGLYNISDERLDHVLGKATSNSFLFSIFFGIGTIIYLSFNNNSIDLFAPAFVFLVGGNLLICLFSVLFYERRGE